MHLKPSKRLARRLKVRFRPRGEEKFYVGYTANVSETGMFVATIRPAPPGTELDVELSNKKHSLRLGAIVVHSRKVPPMWQRIRPSGMGLRFLDPKTADELRQLLGRSGSSW